MNNDNYNSNHHNTYTAKFATKTTRRIYTTTNTGSKKTDEIPLDATPASKITDSTFAFDIKNTYEQAHPKLIRNWKEHISTMGKYNKAMIQESNILHQSDLIEKISNGEPLIIASDGSVYATSSGGAWLIATINGDILVTGSNKDTAHASFQKSYRSEAQAGYASFLFLQEFTTFYGLEIPKVFYYCDNKGLVIKINQKEQDYSKHTEKDLLHLLSEVLPSSTHVQHVMAHQDEKKINLSTEEYLNTIVDFIATNNTAPPLQCHKNQTMAVYIKGEYIPYDIKKMMKRICFEDEAKKMLCKKYKWNSTTFQDISWTEHNKAIESPTFNTRKQKLKFIHNRLSIGVLNYESNNKCPFCNNEEKKIITHPQQDHFLCCNSMIPQHQERINNIQEELRKIHTPENIRKTIIEQLILFYSGTKPPSIPKQHQQFVDKQTEIGWRHFIRG